MNDKASFSLRGRNPDVLTCIANLSNDEVFTPIRAYPPINEHELACTPLDDGLGKAI